MVFILKRNHAILLPECQAQSSGFGLAFAEVGDTMAVLLAGLRLDVSDVEPGT
jgi:hypothetical protein